MSDVHRNGEKFAEVEATYLANELRRTIRGEVRFDTGSRALYATDSSNYRQVPIGVVIPGDKDDVISTIAVCRQFGAPILSRGGGTSLCGQCCNVAVVMDMSKYFNRLIEIDPVKKLARCEPGIVLDRVRDAANKHGLTFGPDPSTHNHCTIGGMLGNNSCGVHSVMAVNEGNGARTSDNTESLEILTYDGAQMRVGPTSDDELESIIRSGGRRGEIYAKLKALRDRYADKIRERYPKIPRRVSGYNLDELLPENGFNVARALVGSESTLVTILEATLKLIHQPPVRSLLVLGYPDVYSAGDHVMEALAFKPTGLEGMDDLLVDDMKKLHIHPEDVALLPDGNGWLMVEFGGETKEESDDKARQLMEALKKKPNPPSMKLFDNPREEEQLWKVRESGLGATAHVPDEKITWEGWEDSAVAPEKMGDYLREFRKVLNKHNYGCTLYGHFGQGVIHTRIDFDLETAAGIANFRSYIEEASDLVVRMGGSISGEHGDGQSKAEMLPKMFGPELMEAFAEFKSIWDPQWKMNPGKVVRPYRIDQNLRLGTTWNPHNPPTHFKFPGDHGSFPFTTLRCVGVGECRRQHAGTMCPSYRVTGEEMHSTRGRAHVLFEMLTGDTIKDGWHDETVKEALDLCLACKGCKGDCPVSVDMATYKAEFLSHYYAGRLRPMYAYAFGLIHVWARLTNAIPFGAAIANFFSHGPIFRNVFKAIIGIAPERNVPAFAEQPFKQWFRSRAKSPNESKPPVVLWPDTFNNYFHPNTAKAAVEVLESAGFRVIVPEADMCCGRPLYDYGMLDTAERWLKQLLVRLQPHIRAGTPLVVLEPSCYAVFKDELVNLLPNNQDAQRLKQQTYLLAEFLDEKAPDYEIPKLHRKAFAHVHCHQKALKQTTADEKLLRRIGLDLELPNNGCCGMAGAFGFEADHYDTSMKVAEHELLPHVRNLPKDTLLIADGFSCREQVRQTTDRFPLHIAQVLQMAQRRDNTASRSYPEEPYITRARATPSVMTVVTLLALVSAVTSSLFARRHRR
ncbi:MAG: FAD-binding and (Fe-S)-binding domain-containing protein [Chthoniobacterales bacterium]